MARVVWTDRAEASLLQIGRFIIGQSQSRQRGLDVISRIEDKCRQYAEFPEGGTLRPDLGPGLRCFPVDNLIVIYRPVADGIAGILVAHGHQDVRTIVERMFGDNG